MPDKCSCAASIISFKRVQSYTEKLQPAIQDFIRTNKFIVKAFFANNAKQRFLGGKSLRLAQDTIVDFLSFGQILIFQMHVLPVFDLDRHLSQMVNFRLIPIYTYSCMKCPNFESYNQKSIEFSE